MIGEGSNAPYRQASNGHFQLLLALNCLKFYRESSKYPYRNFLSKLVDFFHLKLLNST